MTEVLVSGLTKRYGNKAALHGIDLRIESGEFVTLLGPSGCGKTTTLRSLAGLERPSDGVISMGDRVVVDTASNVFVPADKRKVGMVFQSYALWPHMSVAENVAYPLKVAKVGSQERKKRVSEMLEAVGLADYERRPVTALSGGQQQRVALARALAARPGIIFYDEPLSNLDSKLRYQMGQQVRALHDQFETTSIYVTHDQEEAITLSDRIIVMREGRIIQDGTPTNLYDRPNSAYVADFMGFQNIFHATVRQVTDSVVDATIGESGLTVRAQSLEPVSVGDSVDIVFRAAHVRLWQEPRIGPGAVEGIVERVTYMGSALNLLVRVEGLPLRVRLEAAELTAHEVPVAGARYHFGINPELAVCVRPEASNQHDYATHTKALVAPH